VYNRNIRLLPSLFLQLIYKLEVHYITRSAPMRYILIFIIFVSLSYGAGVNELLFSETNTTQEIQKIRAELANVNPSTTEGQNKLNIQKLFLSKLSKLATTSPKDPVKVYAVSKKKTLTQQEFLDYFDTVAENVRDMRYAENGLDVLRTRLSDIKANLSGLSPDAKSDILQGQLEYAYYKWKFILNERKIKAYKTYLKAEKESFLRAFKNTNIDVKMLQKQEQKENAQLQTLYQKKVYLELQLEKETILVASKKKVDVKVDLNQTALLADLKDKDKNWKYNFLLGELDSINKNISKTIKRKNNTLLLQQINNLNENDLDSYIIIRGIMQNHAGDLSVEDKKTFDLQFEMMEWLKYQEIGSFTAFFYDFRTWLDTSYSATITYFNEPLFYLSEQAVRIMDILQMIMTIIIGLLIAKFYKRRVIAAEQRFQFIQKQSFKIAGNIGYYIIVIITLAVSLNNLGVDLSSLSLVAGALSVGIGFGLKEVVGNFVSGIILMVERSARIGDFVEIDNILVGNITDIRMRSVTIKTSSNVDIVVPNSSLVQKSFTNYTLDEPIRRLSVPFTVAYGITFEQVNDAILNALADSDLQYVRDSQKYKAEIIMLGMDERGVNYTLFVFVRTYGPNARSSYFRLIYKTLMENNLPIPAPKLDVKMVENNLETL